MIKKSLEPNFKELSHIKPPLWAKQRLRLRLWFRFMSMRFKTSNAALWMPRLAPVAFSLVILVAIGSTSVYAYQSNQVTTTNILYPLKVAGESLVIAMTNDPSAKAELYLSLAQKRTEETQHQITTSKTIDTGTLVAIETNNKHAMLVAQTITDTTEKKAIENKIVASSRQQVQTLREVKAEGIKIAAAQQSIPLQSISKEDISLGSNSVSNNIDTNLPLPTTTLSEQIVASTPELQVVETILTNTQKFTETTIAAGTGASTLDLPFESINL